MSSQRKPGPSNPEERWVNVDDGTMPRTGTPTPGPIGIRSESPVAAPVQRATWISPEQAAENLSITVGAETTWDSIIREVYKTGAGAISRQAQELMRSGQMSPREAANWANGQRNALIKATRDQSSPIGRAVAELLKPESKLKNVKDLEAIGKSAGGIIESAGKTNPFVNRVTLAFRFGGPSLLVIGIAFSAYHIGTAPEAERWRVGAKEAGTWIGATTVGWGGGIAGCEVGKWVGALGGLGGAALGCAVGAGIGTVIGAIAGGSVGSEVSDFIYRSVEEPPVPTAAAAQVP